MIGKNLNKNYKKQTLKTKLNLMSLKNRNPSYVFFQVGPSVQVISWIKYNQYKKNLFDQIQYLLTAQCIFNWIWFFKVTILPNKWVFIEVINGPPGFTHLIKVNV